MNESKFKCARIESIQIKRVKTKKKRQVSIWELYNEPLGSYGDYFTVVSEWGKLVNKTGPGAGVI